MLEGGEDPLFVARRMVILASEDVGLADPQALLVASAAQQAVHFIGMPEGFFPLAEAALYLALAPKSNSVGRAYGARCRTRGDPQRPGAAAPAQRRHGADAGVRLRPGYQYAHDFADHYSDQHHLPFPTPRTAGLRPGRAGVRGAGQGVDGEVAGDR